jgi:hypothetical protein
VARWNMTKMPISNRCLSKSVIFLSLYFVARFVPLTRPVWHFENESIRRVANSARYLPVSCLTKHSHTYTVRIEPSIAYSLLQLFWNHPVHLNPTATFKGA